jgi:hypothetical protein
MQSGNNPKCKIMCISADWQGWLCLALMYISSLPEESLTIGTSMQQLTLQPGMLCMVLLSKSSHVDALRQAFLGVNLVEVVDNVVPLAVSAKLDSGLFQIAAPH